MRLGVSLPVFTADPAKPLSVAARARELGVDGVFAPDHLFPPVFYPPSGPDRPALEVFSLLAAVAASNPGLHVGTLVTRVTLRTPGLLAKQAAALDAMSDGRAILGIGTGDRASAEEHERYGFPFPPAAERVAHAGRDGPGDACAVRRTRVAGGRARAAARGAVAASRGAGRLGGRPLRRGPRGRRPGRRRVERLGARRRGVRGQGAHASGSSRADGRSPPRGRGSRSSGRTAPTSIGWSPTARARGLSLDGVWSGTAEDWRRFADELRTAGATWCVVLPAGPPDRLDVIAAATLR